MTFDMQRTQEQLRCGSHSLSGIGIARALSAREAAGMGGRNGLRSQRLRAIESRKPAAPSPFFVARVCPSHLSDLWIGERS